MCGFEPRIESIVQNTTYTKGGGQGGSYLNQELKKLYDFEKDEEGGSGRAVRGGFEPRIKSKGHNSTIGDNSLKKSTGQLFLLRNPYMKFQD